MQILFIGHYTPEYPRNASLLKGLRQNGVTVHEVHVELSRARRLFNLMQGWREFYRNHERPDVVMVPMVDLETFPFVFAMSRRFGIPLVYDAFVCRYATWTRERRHSLSSLKSRGLYLFERFVLNHSDLILVDAREHAELFIELYHIPRKRFHVIYISLDDDLYQPLEKSSDASFIIQFLGFFHPLTGADTIIRAAALLREENDLVIELIGMKENAESQAIFDLANSLNVRNIKFMDAIPYAEQPEHMKRASVCLGVFGDTDQAARVFPNKGYQALAMAKPLITRDCPALREILEPGVHVEAVPPADPRALAGAMLKLKRDSYYRFQLAQQGYECFQTRLTPRILGAELSQRLQKVLNNV